MFTYEAECPKCKIYFDCHKKLADRNTPSICPKCGFNKCARVFLTAPAVIWFPGSFTHDDRVDKLDRMAKEAQAEGFRSEAEMETAMAQAQDRAKKLGIAPEKILGGTKANFEGELKIDPKDQAKHKKLFQEYVETGTLKKDIKKAAKAQKDLKAFEGSMRKKYQGQRKYKPTKDIATMAKEAKAQQKLFTNQV